MPHVVAVVTIAPRGGIGGGTAQRLGRRPSQPRFTSASLPLCWYRRVPGQTVPFSASPRGSPVLIEQAFCGLPESLLGSHYPRQEYEAGLVTALIMAILQELNGRNAPNPLSFLQGERLYKSPGFQVGAGFRYLRADLHCNLTGLAVANRRLEKYGWRFQNWLEAKFFRNEATMPNNQSNNKTTHTADLLADLIRLIVLVPETPGKQSFCARYILHVYDTHPRLYLAERKNAIQNPPTPRFNRNWVRSLWTAGTHELAGFRLNEEAPTVLGRLGQALSQLVITATVRNLVTEPVVDPVNDERLYWCVLTRIDAASVTHQGRSFQLHADRRVTQGADGDYQAIQDFVAANLNITAPADEEPPEPGEQGGPAAPVDPPPLLPQQDGGQVPEGAG